VAHLPDNKAGTHEGAKLCHHELSRRPECLGELRRMCCSSLWAGEGPQQLEVDRVLGNSVDVSQAGFPPGMSVEPGPLLKQTPTAIKTLHQGSGAGEGMRGAGAGPFKRGASPQLPLRCCQSRTRPLPPIRLASRCDGSLGVDDAEAVRRRVQTALLDARRAGGGLEHVIHLEHVASLRCQQRGHAGDVRCRH